MKMKLLFYVILVFIFLVIFRNWYVENVLKEKMKPIHNRLKEMLPFIIKYLDEEGIKWVIYSGNLLGMYRHNNSFVPWDDDIDILILKEDDTLDNRLKNVDMKLKRNDMYFKDAPFGYAVHNKDQTVEGNKAYIDLFIYEKEGDIWIGNDWARTTFPKEYFKEEMLFPFKKGMFEGIEVNIPNDSIGWLKQNYGNNCLHSGKVTHIHQGNFFERSLILITCKVPLYF